MKAHLTEKEINLVGYVKWIFGITTTIFLAWAGWVSLGFISLTTNYAVMSSTLKVHTSDLSQIQDTVNAINARFLPAVSMADSTNVN